MLADFKVIMCFIVDERMGPVSRGRVFSTRVFTVLCKLTVILDNLCGKLTIKLPLYYTFA
jgi:hypothetical protein